MQPTQRLFVAAALVVAALVGGGTALYGRAVPDNKTYKLKLKLPQSDTLVTVDGKEVKGDGEERAITVTSDKDTIHITAFWEPNNYTKITRPRKVKWKEGEITVEFLKPSDKEKDDIVAAMCKLGKVSKKDVVFDLGCGDGRMVIMAVEKFNAKRGVGVDLDPKLVAESKENAVKHGVENRVEFRKGDVLKINDLSDADVVLLYMGDDITPRLKPILQKTLKAGSRVVSHRFLMGDDWQPETTETIRSNAGYDCLIHLWTIKKK